MRDLGFCFVDERSTQSHRGLASPGFICDPDNELSESERQKVQQAGPLLTSEVTCVYTCCHHVSHLDQVLVGITHDTKLLCPDG